MPYKIGPERSHDVCGSIDLHEIGLGQKNIKGFSVHEHKPLYSGYLLTVPIMCNTL